MSRHAQRFWKPRRYRHTHVSVADGSPAQRIASTHSLITLMNEDGQVWTDDIENWREIDDA